MRPNSLVVLAVLAFAPILMGQAESDLQSDVPNPVLQQQTERIRDELAEKQGGQRPRGAPGTPRSQRQNQGQNQGSGQGRAQRKVQPGSVFPLNVESDTDSRIPNPVFLQQRERILKEVAAKPDDPAFTAEVKARWKNEYKRTDGHPTRGHKAICPVTVPFSSPAAVEGAPLTAPANQYITEVNLYVDYETECNWIEVKLQFKNYMGIENGTTNKLKAAKGWIGYDVFDNRWGDLDLEAGRKPTDEIFDSRIQFDCLYDGLLVTYRRRWEETGELLFHGGPCIVDAQTSHFAFLGEIILTEAFKTGAYGKYSLAWWRKKGVDQYNIPNTPESRYINSQLLLGYDFAEKFFCLPVRIYAAGVLNSAAEIVPASAGKKRNFGWYAAFQLGRLKKAGDLFFDMCYQDVGLQTVPAYDFSGIGRGNSTAWGDPAVIADPFNPGNYAPNSAVLTVPAYAVQGNNNYRGVATRLKYNVTDELTLSATFDISCQKSRAVGGSNNFHAFEAQAIYGF